MYGNKEFFLCTVIKSFFKCVRSATQLTERDLLARTNLKLPILAPFRGAGVSSRWGRYYLCMYTTAAVKSFFLMCVR